MNDNTVFTPQKLARAINLTRQIKLNAQAAQESLWEVCRGLKEMHDLKLYIEIGYKTFRDYCTNELDITDRQARNYITLAESFSDEERKSISALGSTKLLLLAKLDEPQREEIVQTTDLESTSVRELREKIAELDKRAKDAESRAAALSESYDRIEKQNSKHYSRMRDLEAENAALEAQTKTLETKLDESNKEGIRVARQRGELESKIREKEQIIISLEETIEELEDRPIEVAVQESAEAETIRSEYEEQLRQLNSDHADEMEKLRKKYQQKLNKGIEEAKKNASAPNITGLWDALYDSLDNALDAVQYFFEDYPDHPKIKTYADKLKGRMRTMNTALNDAICKRTT